VSVEEAVAEFMLPLNTDNRDWAKPYLDEARAQIARGEYR
jgi:hypothetical protein